MLGKIEWRVRVGTTDFSHAVAVTGGYVLCGLDLSTMSQLPDMVARHCPKCSKKIAGLSKK